MKRTSEMNLRACRLSGIVHTVLALLLLTVVLGGLVACRDGRNPGADGTGVADGTAVVTDESGHPIEPATNPDGTPVETDPSGTGASEGTDSPGVTRPSDGTDEEPDTDEASSETLPYDPDDHPGDASLYEGVFISAVYGTGKKGAEAVIAHGFVQLYNSTNRDVSLKGASLYYKTDGGNPFAQFVFPEDAVIPAGGYYLVRANAPADFVAGNAILAVDHCDAEWDIYLDNKEIRLVFAPSGWRIGTNEDVTAFKDANSVFVATDSYLNSVCAVHDLSRSKMAVRTALTDYSGYHVVNLTKANSSDLKKLCPSTSAGDVNTTVNSRLSEVTFSHDAGIYGRAIVLEMDAPAGYTIYYTMDGSDPTVKSNANRKTYGAGITLKDSSAMAWGAVTRTWGNYNGNARPSVSQQVGGYVIKAYATNGTDSTPIYTNTYFITDDLEQYGVTVMSISIPLSEMIGAQGFYNNFSTDGTITGVRRRGTAVMEVFDENGERVGNSVVELAVSGNGSSGFAMKSLRIYYKGALNETAGLQNDLYYDLFDGLAVDNNGAAITDFSRLLLRNSGNDCGVSYIRDAYMQRVCAGLYVDTMAAASTLVFVNGEFWGVYNIRERYSPEYVENHYGISKENVTVIESDYSQVHTNTNADYIVSSGAEGDADPFNELVKYMKEHNLSNEEYYRYVCERMDIDSFIDMWVVRLYFNAIDWPENNIKVWRNKNPDDPSGFDTKWHFTLLDMDMGLSFYDFTSEDDNCFNRINRGSVCGNMMCDLLENEGFRNRFILRYYEVVNEHFTVEYLSETFEALYAERTPLMPLQVGRWPSDGASTSRWESTCNDIRSFISNRNRYALQYLYSYFGISEADIENLSQKKVSVSFHSGRVDVTLDGKAIENGTVIKLEDGETRTLKLVATAKEGYTVTSIAYTDRNGSTQTVEGTEATFRVSNSGTVAVYTKRTNPDSGNLGEGTLVAGATYLFYLTGDGDLYAWGDNRYGVLGLGTSGGSIMTPTYVMSGVAKVVTSSGNAYENGDSTFSTAILTTDGRLLTVGRNTCGQLGRNGTTDSATLAQVNFSGVIVDVSLGHDHLLILDENGTMWGIGSNAYGALGTKNLGGNVTSFTKVAEQVAFMSAGRRSTAYVTDDGRMWGLGDNRWKKMSQSQGEQIHTAVVIAENMAFVSSGEHQLVAVDQAGKLYYAGWRTVNGFGQGGGNNPTFYHMMNGVEKADIYFGNMVILTVSGDAYVYGLNTDNGIGSSAVTNGTPKKILSGVVDVAAGYGFTAYLMEDGTIRVQGSNAFGQAGNGTAGGTVNLVEADI